METEFFDIKGFVRMVKPNGFGFIVPMEKLNPNDSKKSCDIYFHASNVLNEGLEWKNIQTGMKVTISVVVKKATGYSAGGVLVNLKKR